MKKLNEEIVCRELTSEELYDITGGDGKWHLGEALLAYALLGPIGLGFYTVGTMQN